MVSTESGRLHGLDLIRGIAVMGIALMNVGSFALPPGAYDNPAALGRPSSLDLLVWSVEFVFIDGKMRALFSILFGASMLLVADRVEARGIRPLRFHVRRMLALLLIGIGHALLIWPGDILILYALAGLAVWPMRAKPVHALLVAALLCLVAQWLISSAGVAALYALRDAASAPDATHSVRSAWAELLGQIGCDGGGAAAQARTLHLGSYGDGLAHRIATAWEERVDQFAGTGLETAGLMLIGMAALRSGGLSGAWPPRVNRRLAAWAITGSAAAELILLLACSHSRFEPIQVYAAAVVGGAPLRPLMALGYAAAALGVAHSGLAAPVRAVGRMALSCYVGTSIVLTLLFDGYGAGLFGRLSRTELLIPVASCWAAMLLFCPLWMRRFRHGPLEWLWRSATDGALQPLRRRFTIAT